MEIAAVGKYEDRLGAVFAALADPTRRTLVEKLRAGDATVGELATGFTVGVPAISKHLTVLEKAGLISRHPDAQWRHCRLETQAFEELNEWMSHFTTLWTGSLDRLDGYLEELQANKDQP
ncbi:ArsR/SmtB family transcription factor [Leifsonia sp. NPDC058230]|uniref:ArsR/SmtB family transcription factor n=1 Tax=Leifsonia sp. NPDC058230 TaxID=3346391 RepID=UPI0036DE3A6C